MAWSTLLEETEHLLCLIWRHCQACHNRDQNPYCHVQPVLSSLTMGRVHQIVESRFKEYVLLLVEIMSLFYVCLKLA